MYSVKKQVYTDLDPVIIFKSLSRKVSIGEDITEPNDNAFMYFVALVSFPCQDFSNSFFFYLNISGFQTSNV